MKKLIVSINVMILLATVFIVGSVSARTPSANEMRQNMTSANHHNTQNKRRTWHNRRRVRKHHRRNFTFQKRVKH